MTHDDDITYDQHVQKIEALPLLEIASGLASGVHTLVPNCTAAIVAGLGSDWQLLAKRGSGDVRASWSAALAGRVRDSDLSEQTPRSIVAPFSAVSLHALLVLVADDGQPIPERALAIVQPLLDAGGILLDRALAMQERDRAVRRIVLLCQQESGRRSHTLADLEHSLTLLWPSAVVTFHERSALEHAAWSTRRLVRTACELDQPAVSRFPADDGLLPPDLIHQIAIPVPVHAGALLIEAQAGGEELDTASVAAAIALARESAAGPGHGTHTTRTLTPVVNHA